MVVGFFFTKADEWSDAVRTRRKSDARHLPFSSFSIRHGDWYWHGTLESHTFGRNSNAYVCRKNKIRPLPFSEGGKISEFGGREGIAREKFCRPLERIIERACSSSDKQKGHDTFRTTTDATGFLQSSWNESTVYLHRIVECARFPIFNGGRVAFRPPPPPPSPSL